MTAARPVYEVALHPAALREYRAAARWYAQKSRPVAGRLTAAVDRPLAEIGVQPDHFGRYDAVFREAPTRRYPYTVIHRVNPAGDGLAAAVAHASREPGYWHGRV